ncbi:MAG: DUF5682 family protein [Armatimonadota bacterium]
MGGSLQSPEVDLLIPEVDLNDRIIYFPVRHHSPACSWHVSRLIRELKPDAVLIEGPRDATPLIPFLTHKQVRMPVAIFTTYVRRHRDELPERFAAYYPLCDYSPELAAIKIANEVGAEVKFIDLSFPEMVNSRKDMPDGKAQSLLDEHYLKHSQFLNAACQRTGTRDSEDLWDHLYESDYTRYDTSQFIRNVLTYCAMARADYTPEMLAAEGIDAREGAMAAAIKEVKGRAIVITGGFHSVVLNSTKPRLPRKVEVPPEDALVVLTRYSFEQLDRLNGYASGMPSPEFYQRSWEGQDASQIIVELSTALRGRGCDASTDDSITSLGHCRRLAAFRGHSNPTREDLLDAVRSVFIKGSEDIEGILVMSTARKLLAGNRIGSVPAEAGQPPIVADFRQNASKLRVDLDATDTKEVALDLYRKTSHRDISRFFHRLFFLDTRFASLLAGPDFVRGLNLDRIQEVWQYRWSPDTEASLIEKSVYGSTIEEASSSLLLERFTSIEAEGQGRRADIATSLLLTACRMGLHKHTQDLLGRIAGLVSEDASVVSLVGAITDLLLLHESREPLEANNLQGVAELAQTAFRRACYLVPGLAATPEAEESSTLDALNALSAVPLQLDSQEEFKELLWDRLGQLLALTTGNSAIRGSVSGILYSDGRITAGELVEYLRGHLLSSGKDNAAGISFLRGLLFAARSTLWQVTEVIEIITEVLAGWDEDTFVGQLPNLRLAFANLTPRECDHVAEAVSAHFNAGKIILNTHTEYSASDMMHSVDLNRLVLQALEQDKLKDWIIGDEKS